MRILFWLGAAITVFLLPANPALADGAAAPLPVPKQTIYPGDIITGDMLTSKPAEQIKGVGALETDEDSLIGKTARRTLLPGQPIPKVAVRNSYVVLPGEDRSAHLPIRNGHNNGRRPRARIGERWRNDQRSKSELRRCHSRHRSA